MFNTIQSRSHYYNDLPVSDGPVIWWIQRDQRLSDNWTYIAAARLATENNQPVLAVFCLQQEFLGASERSFDFMLSGLKKLAEQLAVYSIPIIILNLAKDRLENPISMLQKLAADVQASAVITDFNPLRHVVAWKEEAASLLTCSLIEIDAHNIVPCRQASVKQEYAARTFRPKINKLLPLWLHDYPDMQVASARQHSFYLSLLRDEDEVKSTNPADWQRLKQLRSKIADTRDFFSNLNDNSSQLNNLPRSGTDNAVKQLEKFIAENIGLYHMRNDPNKPAVSGLSPYLHFGQISAQRIALEVSNAAVNNPEIKQQSEDFLEELIVRRELSDNFCFYNPNYDNFDGFPAWARKSLNMHAADMRPYLYSKEQLENAVTHDELWNAAQHNLVRTGSMPGYLRMYWAKKILEWTISPQEALSITIELNDRYMLDGRDPNGYTGAAWSIGGVHDRPWADRPVFGQIRLMTLSGCKRKFDVADWVKKYG